MYVLGLVIITTLCQTSPCEGRDTPERRDAVIPVITLLILQIVCVFDTDVFLHHLSH